MPSIILLDNSFTIECKYINEMSIKKTMEGAVLEFVGLIEEQQPLEHLALCAFSNDMKILVPLSKEFHRFPDELFKLETEDKSRIGNALKKAMEYVDEKSATDFNSQIILITNGNTSSSSGRFDSCDFQLIIPSKI